MYQCIYFVVHSSGGSLVPVPSPYHHFPFSLSTSLANITYVYPPSDISVFIYVVHLYMKHGKFYFYFSQPTLVSSLIDNSESQILDIVFLRNKIIFYRCFCENVSAPSALNLHSPHVRCVQKQQWPVVFLYSFL